MKKRFTGFQTRPDTNRVAQPQKIARGLLKFRIQKVEGLYYLSGENKGAGQLRSCAADLRLCFRICKKLVFSQRGSYLNKVVYLFIFIEFCRLTIT